MAPVQKARWRSSQSVCNNQGATRPNRCAHHVKQNESKSARGAMSATRLLPRTVEKPWGRYDLPAWLAYQRPGARVGELWFEDPRGGGLGALLVKYLFTSERLSIQVHPDDALARSEGLVRGKDEAWLILDADEFATIGLGLRTNANKEELRAAALDGTIEQLLDWRPATAGDFYYSPAGTVHAIGPGLTMIEIQQNVDVTYRLYDYGRPRELHVDLAVVASNPEPYRPPCKAEQRENGRTILAQGVKFVVERWTGARSATLAARANEPLWAIPITGPISAATGLMDPGTVWLIEGEARFVMFDDAELLLAYPGATVRDEKTLCC